MRATRAVALLLCLACAGGARATIADGAIADAVSREWLQTAAAAPAQWPCLGDRTLAVAPPPPTPPPLLSPALQRP